MLKLSYGTAGFDEGMRALYERPAFPPEAETAAASIIAGVRERGDAALVEYAAKFDRAQLTPADFILPLSEAKKIADRLPAADKKAIRQALAQVQIDQAAQLDDDDPPRRQSRREIYADGTGRSLHPRRDGSIGFHGHPYCRYC